MLKGLAPSGLSFTELNFVKELLLNLPFKAHTKYKNNGGDTGKNTNSTGNNFWFKLKKLWS